jgi:hypothetical protein
MPSEAHDENTRTLRIVQMRGNADACEEAGPALGHIRRDANGGAWWANDKRGTDGAAFTIAVVWMEVRMRMFL